MAQSLPHGMQDVRTIGCGANEALEIGTHDGTMKDWTRHLHTFATNKCIKREVCLFLMLVETTTRAWLLSPLRLWFLASFILRIAHLSLHIQLVICQELGV